MPHINSSDNTTRAQAERQAINTTIQGSAADIAKTSIIQFEKKLDKYYNKGRPTTDSNLEVNFVLHLHDEILLEVPELKLNKIAKILAASMENCVKLNVQLRVKLKAGKSWGTLKDM